MAFRKNKKFIDPRYFMDEKIEHKIEESAPTHTEVKEEISYVPKLINRVMDDIVHLLSGPDYLKLDFAHFEIADQIAKALEQVARDIRDNARTRS